MELHITDERHEPRWLSLTFFFRVEKHVFFSSREP